MRFPVLHQHNLIAIDTETNGLGWEARPVGISWCIKVASKMLSGYVRWGHPTNNSCTIEEAHAWWQSEVDQPGTTLVMHNAQFDMKMLALAGFKIRFARVEDTMIVSNLLNEYEPSFSLNALGQKYTGVTKKDDHLHEWMVEHLAQVKKPTRSACAPHYWRVPGNVISEYAAGDAEATLALYLKRRPKIREEELERLYEVETLQLPILLKMYIAGVRVNLDRAEEVKQSLEGDYYKLAMRWKELAGDANMRSGPDLAKLFDSYKIPYPRTAKGRPSFAKESLKLTAEDHEIPRLILGLRRLATLRGTFIDSYIKGNAIDGLIHADFNSILGESGGAVSGRYSSSGPNLQNIPARDEVWAPLVRGLFIPFEGMEWVKADYSQIEYRIFAHYAGGKLLEAYINNPDIDYHQMVADLTGQPRRHAKNINFAGLYGAGQEKIALMMGMDIDEAVPIFEEYHRRVPEVNRTSKKVVGIATQRQYIKSWGGRKHRFPRHLRSKNRKAQPWKALNRLCQGGAADLIKYAMIAVDQAIDWDNTILHLTVHDELDFSNDPGEVGQRAIKRIEEAMCDTKAMNSPMGPIKAPVKVDIKSGPDWGHCTPYEETV